MACRRTGAAIKNFTAAPVYFKEEQNQGAHEWVIEFAQPPSDMGVFQALLDESLREVNSDYDAKRYKNMVLRPPIIHVAHPGTFDGWLKSRGKLGGQNKVPRLSNSREYLDEIMKFL
jgi:hypothetical protein